MRTGWANIRLQFASGTFTMIHSNKSSIIPTVKSIKHIYRVFTLTALMLHSSSFHWAASCHRVVMPASLLFLARLALFVSQNFRPQHFSLYMSTVVVGLSQSSLWFFVCLFNVMWRKKPTLMWSCDLYNTCNTGLPCSRHCHPQKNELNRFSFHQSVHKKKKRQKNKCLIVCKIILLRKCAVSPVWPFSQLCSFTFTRHTCFHAHWWALTSCT